MLLGIVAASNVSVPQATVFGQDEVGSSTIYLPAVSRQDPPTPTPTLTPAPTVTAVATTMPLPTQVPLPATPPSAVARRVNAPFFAGEIAFEQMGIFWFGRLSETSNYADVRIGYNQDSLSIYVAAFDRRLWYDETPSTDTLTDWDAVTLLMDAGSGGNALSPSTYRFVAQLSGAPSAASHRAAYQGSAQGWQAKTLAFETNPGWRGNELNNDKDSDRGWAMTFT
ncbi:MAG: hypothetical protein WAU00_10315, partial [Caldilinea sp.]